MGQQPDIEEKTGSLVASSPKNARKPVANLEPEGQTETSVLVSAIRDSLKQPSAKEITDLGDMQHAMVEDQKTDTRLKKIYAYWFIGILNQHRRSPGSAGEAVEV